MIPLWCSYFILLNSFLEKASGGESISSKLWRRTVSQTSRGMVDFEDRRRGRHSGLSARLDEKYMYIPSVA